MKRILCIAFALLIAATFGCRSGESFEGAQASLEPTPIKEIEKMIDPAPPIVQSEIGKNEPIAVEDYQGFAALTAIQALGGRTDNANYSPISLYLALSLAAEGASGETLAELLSALGAEDLESLRASNADMWAKLKSDNELGVLELNNSLWCNDTLPVYDSYKELAASYYNAEVESLPLGEPASWARIGSWIAEKTRGTIEPEVELSAEDLLVLINTIYLKAQWASIFDSNANTVEDFTLADGTKVSADFMNQTLQDGQIFFGEDYARCHLHLQGVGEMRFILPGENSSLNALLADGEALENALYGGSAEDRTVVFSLPKFTFTDKYELIPMLQSLGVYSAFDGEAADFSNMSELSSFITRILQETYINVNELGVEAAAYTMITMRNTAAFEEPPTYVFALDRPFLFAITANDGTLLFVGAVQNPNQ
ncbi:MAG: serpin family protein [Clostridia bacterium]|nr:serpin family protein [Clostridia bacterium]